MKKGVKELCVGALIAALYVGLTFMSNLFGIAYGPVQFRFSEALTVLPVFTPAAIWGLSVGCFISNIASFNPIDMIFGTVATLSAALLSYSFKKIKLFSLPVLSCFMPVILNAAVIGAEITLFISKDGTLTAFLVSAGFVALGEIVTSVGLGLLLYTAINKNRSALKFITS